MFQKSLEVIKESQKRFRVDFAAIKYSSIFSITRTEDENTGRNHSTWKYSDSAGMVSLTGWAQGS